jgi:hypothetical protein
MPSSGTSGPLSGVPAVALVYPASMTDRVVVLDAGGPGAGGGALFWASCDGGWVVVAGEPVGNDAPGVVVVVERGGATVVVGRAASDALAAAAGRSLRSAGGIPMMNSAAARTAPITAV